MSARARVDSMKPSTAPSTRTADPRPPDQFWTRGNYLGYIAFGSCGLVMMLVALGVLRRVWVLGEGEAAWNALIESTSHPLYVLWHAFALGALTWFGFRFFRVFPKTQPPRIGPAPRPPDLAFKLLLNGGFVVVTLLVGAVLGGFLP